MARRLSSFLIALTLVACSFQSTPVPSEAERPANPPADTQSQQITPPPEQGASSTAPPEVGQANSSQVAPTADQSAAVVAGSLDDPARIDAADPAPRDQTGLVEAFQGGDLPDVARTTPLDVQVGDVETFWIADILNDTNYEVNARLRYAGPAVLMYVDTEVEDAVDQADIERSARQFEESIYPRNRELFGAETSPGVDGDPRLTILNTPLRGAGGYFSSADGVVKAVNRFSNEREMFVIGINSYPIGTESYASTLAHEFQHMIEWNEARRSPSWFNEGLSTLAEDLNGFVNHSTAALHLANPDIQLTTWAGDSAQSGAHYGTSQLFFRYFYDQYAQESGVVELIRLDAGNNIEEFVPIAQRKQPEITSFADIIADWAVANALNDPTIDNGRYSYELLPATVEATLIGRGSGSGEVSQFGADYLQLPQGRAILTFDGSDVVSITGAPTQSGSYAWWSNRGDDSISTMTRAFDLSGVSAATLQFSVWHEIELNWDYAFVTVSIDGGKTWTTLQGSTTVSDDPQGNNIGGQGLTGVSGASGQKPDQGVKGQWIEEQMDLTPFVGRQILLRFWLIHDAAYNATGMLIDNIRIPEINYNDDVEGGEGGWEAQGFVRTTGTLPQRWTLRLVREGRSGTTVEPVQVDAQGRATVQLDEGEAGRLVVIGSTPHTTQVAPYVYEVAEN